MLSRRAKAIFYQLASPLMRINALSYRYFRAPRESVLKVHLGPGQANYIEGYLNVDANIFTAKCDLWADLRNPLPFHDESVDCFYSHHVIEHLPNLQTHFREVYRCLKPGGVYRVGGPNGDSAIIKFLEKDTRWFSDFPDKRTSIGGRLENFIFCRGEHLTILTFSFLDELCKDNGFTSVKLYKPVKETGYPELFNSCLSKEYESDFDVPHTLIVEAVKPGKD
uniref:Methyltransferase type 11 n=1 Tax=Cyanothece sp. (strain PCC 7425 / ATCC 29141) TaxID=395961 RepID=B8HND3_CYAP4